MALPVQINPKHNKSTLERVCFYYEENFIRGLLRGCIGGASLNCINFVVPMNPCPCGYYPDMGRCRCTQEAVRRYQEQLSGPILDRIDICAEVLPLSMEELASGSGQAESSAVIRARVLRARERQEKRGGRFNAALTPEEIGHFCKLDGEGKRMLEKAFGKMKLSARAYHRILRVARTIADLDGSEKIGKLHLAEAVSCRMAGSRYWNEPGMKR